MTSLITKNVRLRLSEGDWRKLRIMAAENNMSVTAMVRYIVIMELLLPVEEDS